ncbi:hypothetical protein OA668_01170 [Candidatus Pelagibacter sp.]|nr:hypothetical protein [Candidatus Pelagibacter sp.]
MKIVTKTFLGFIIFFSFTNFSFSKEYKMKCIYDYSYKNKDIFVNDKNKGKQVSFVYNENTKEVSSYPYESVSKNTVFLKNNVMVDISWMFDLKTSDTFSYSYSFTKERFSTIRVKGELAEYFYHKEKKDIILSNYYECLETLF